MGFPVSFRMVAMVMPEQTILPPVSIPRTHPPGPLESQQPVCLLRRLSSEAIGLENMSGPTKRRRAPCVNNTISAVVEQFAYLYRFFYIYIQEHT